VHKQGLALIQAQYASQAEAATKIAAGLNDFYRAQYPAIYAAQRGAVDAAAKSLVAIYQRNVFPEMKVTWGTYTSGMGIARQDTIRRRDVPLPRREPYVEGREDDHQRLQRVP